MLGDELYKRVSEYQDSLPPKKPVYTNSQIEICMDEICTFLGTATPEEILKHTIYVNVNVDGKTIDMYFMRPVTQKKLFSCKEYKHMSCVYKKHYEYECGVDNIGLFHNQIVSKARAEGLTTFTDSDYKCRITFSYNYPKD